MTTKLLFTPGSLTTSPTVKSAMLHDAGSRDADFIAVVRSIRESLLAIGGAAPGGNYECVLMQGRGTFAIESVISSAIPRDGRLLVAVNGAYGCRIALDPSPLRVVAPISPRVALTTTYLVLGRRNVFHGDSTLLFADHQDCK
jgi:hypothetical protein